MFHNLPFSGPNLNYTTENPCSSQALIVAYAAQMTSVPGSIGQLCDLRACVVTCSLVEHTSSCCNETPGCSAPKLKVAGHVYLCSHFQKLERLMQLS